MNSTVSQAEMMNIDGQTIRSENVNPRHAAGKNLSLLLGLPVSRKVLIVGAGLKMWSGLFSGSTFCENLSVEVCGDFDLVLYHCFCAKDEKELSQHLQLICRLVGLTGQVILFAHNVYSPAVLKRFKGDSKLNVRCVRRSLGHYRRVIGRAGFEEIREFVALPGVVDVEEFVSPLSSFLELPYYLHPLLHLAHKFGVFWMFADGYIFVAGSVPIENGQVLSEVSSMLRLADNQQGWPYVIERFDLRVRGAMVIFVVERDTGRKLIIRIVSDNKTDVIVRKNNDFLNAMQANPDVSDAVKCQLPRPLGEFSLTGSSIYVETLMEGVLAWKVNRTRLRKRIQAEAAEFIFQFQYATRRKVRLDTSELNELFEADLSRLAGCHELNPLLLKRVSEAVEEIRQSLYGREVFLTASHGDFGYGNILVDAGSGKLKGVIDWDTGRMRDLPGIDYLNMEVQRIRIESGCELSTAFHKVAATILLNGYIDHEGRYRKFLNTTADLLPALLFSTLIRYVTRAAQYPEVFAAEQSQYFGAFDLLSVDVEVVTLSRTHKPRHNA